MNTRFIRAFYTGAQDYDALYPRNFTSFKEFRYYMRGKRFMQAVAKLFPVKGNQYD